ELNRRPRLVLPRLSPRHPPPSLPRLASLRCHRRRTSEVQALERLQFFLNRDCKVNSGVVSMINHRLFTSVWLTAVAIPLSCVLIGCQGLAKGPATNTPPTGNSLQTSVNHIVFMAQENRSFDHYFGAMRQYWVDFGYPDQPLDGLPQFPTTAPSGTTPTN